MTPLVGFEFVAGSSSAPTHLALSDHEDNLFKCVRCNYGGCDIKVSGCECSYHVRCLPIDATEEIKACPHCKRPTSGLMLNPLSFTEVDEAHKASLIMKVSSKRGRKRKGSVISENESVDDYGSSTSMDSPAVMNDKKDMGMMNCRTGRWTPEEINFCDTLISMFQQGQLPLAKGVKLNDFLTSMLKSKQSRLTKKRKNAKLSSQTYVPLSLYIMNDAECHKFSKLEDSFFLKIQDPGERAELKFHMRKEWRDMFCNFCVKVGHKLDADAWLTSVDEMDRRATIASNASRMKRRKVMMVNALNHDYTNAEAGVFIERSEAEVPATMSADEDKKHFGHGLDQFERDEFLSLLSDDVPSTNVNATTHTNDDSYFEMNGKSSILHSSPFLHMVSTYIKKRNIPFEQVDLWVPSLTPSPDQSSEAKCRLNFAGSTTMDSVIPSGGTGPAEPMNDDMKFKLLSFGDYSQKFSFDVGCGLPGRVYADGACTWEQNVQIAPSTHFERCGGANQWGIKTVVGIPVASPNVGRIIILLYSVHNRKKCENMVLKLKNEFTNLMPTPKWKLVVDVSIAKAKDPTKSLTLQQSASTTEAESDNETANTSDTVIDSIIRLLGNEMPSNPGCAITAQVQNLMYLRLLLLRTRRSNQEDEIVNTIIGSYSSYSKSGRSNRDISVMLAQDFMFLTQSQQSVSRSTQQFTPPQHNDPITHHVQYPQHEQTTLGHTHVPQVSPTMSSIHYYDKPMPDQKLSPYTGLDIFRPDSPALTPILPLEDSLSIVSN